MDLKVTVRICGITPTTIIEVWCNGSTPTGVGFVAIDAREESHDITLLKYQETCINWDGYLFVSNATRLKNVQSAL